MTDSPEQFIPRLTASRWRIPLLALLGLCLIAGCWKAGFILYDDPFHISDNPHVVPGTSLLETFKPQPGYTYFPLTELSYRLDRKLFEGWMPGLLGSYAPGIRFMNWVCHVLAVLVLWRVLLRLGQSAGAAYFCAAVFAAHPLWTEAVCWVSERKTVLAGCLGFAAVWAWEAGRQKRWRVPAASALYLLAMMAKPSVLGLLPVFVLLECVPGLARADGPWFSKRWLASACSLFPMALISAGALWVNISRHPLLAPPGGSVFTALLTDLEILCRYLGNALAPVRLSAVYAVDPVCSVFDARVFLYGGILAAVIAASVWLAANRRRAILGWLWFVSALGPSLNLVAIAYYMQDRYLYLSLPGLLLVAVEAAAGLRQRWPACSEGVLRRAAAGFVLLLACGSGIRSQIWVSSRCVFEDAVNRQPLAAYAHYGLGSAYGADWQKTSDNPAEELKNRSQWLKHWELALACPDMVRFGSYSEVAVAVGDGYGCEVHAGLPKAERIKRAEHYWRMGAYPPPEVPERTAPRVQALCNLTLLCLKQNRPGEAYCLAGDGLSLIDRPQTRLLRAKAALAWARLRPAGDRAALLNEARALLQTVPPDGPFANEAKRLLLELR